MTRSTSSLPNAATDTTALLKSLREDSPLWPARVVALELEVTSTNARAHALYERLGFGPKKNTTLRLTASDG